MTSTKPYTYHDWLGDQINIAERERDAALTALRSRADNGEALNDDDYADYHKLDREIGTLYRCLIEFERFTRSARRAPIE